MAIQQGISHPSALIHPSPLIDNEATQVIRMAIQEGISHPSAIIHPSPLIDNEATQVYTHCPTLTFSERITENFLCFYLREIQV